MSKETTTQPQRIQRKRTAGWRKPDGAVYVGRGSKWGNRFAVGKAQVRAPGIDGAEWEFEGRLHKTSGERHGYMRYIDGKDVYTWHQVEDATAGQCVQLYRETIGLDAPEHLANDFSVRPYPAEMLAELAGKDLMCWCPLNQPCHADVLLELANGAKTNG